MWACSFHLPRFLCFHHSNSRPPESSTAAPRNDTSVSFSSGLSTSPCSRPPSRPSPSKQDATTGTSCHSAPGHQFGDFVDQPSRALRPVTSIDIVESNSPEAASVPSAQRHPYLSCPPYPTDSTQFPQTLVTQHSLKMISRQPLDPEHLTPSSSPYLRQQQYQNKHILKEAHDFTMIGPAFIDDNHGNSEKYALRVSGPPTLKIFPSVTLTTNISTTSTQFMKELLMETIPGAAYSSSARYPPPRCHPGTRLAILERCLYFIANCTREKKMRWVVGAAGVGKSAIMQNVAEFSQLPVSFHASVFFSINGRNDGTKAIMTLSYQFAAKSKAYRQVIEDEITHDPSLLQSSMPVQFEKFIIAPFIYSSDLSSTGRVLIIIDGLDECNNHRSQIELLHLISKSCLSYPSSPLVWLIASRPETHITSFFSRAEVMPAYEKEEIPVDSDESRADVERFLRDKLTELKEESDSLNPQWPEDRDFWKLANAAGGLFAYAQTVIRYISDWTIGSPVSQLLDVLSVIDEHPMADVSREEHPMALLDALYDRILSNVPPKIMINTRRLLLALASGWDLALKYSGTGWTLRSPYSHPTEGKFVVLCNWLGMTPDEAYAAINHLRSVLYVPRRNKAHEEEIKVFHKSFIDYISDFTRSGFSPDIELEAQKLKTRCASRILKEAPDGVNLGDVDYQFVYGVLAHAPDIGDTISLTWPIEEGGDLHTAETRSSLYKLAIGEVVAGMQRRDPIFQNTFCIRLLTTRFKKYRAFPYHPLRSFVFDESQRHGFMTHGILRQMPLKAVNVSTINFEVKLRFRRSATTVTNLSDPWNSSCEHVREGKWEEGKVPDWMTIFWETGCAFCFERLKRQLKRSKIQSPHDHVPVLFTSTGMCCIEFRFLDPGDMSEWTYWVWIKLTSDERKMYGSTI